MFEKHNIALCVTTAFLLVVLCSCSVNPFSPSNEFTGSPTGTLIGTGAGAGTAALVGASKAEMLFAGLAGGALGYYVTSLPFTAGGITHVDGKVYTLGESVTIEIPSDSLFEVNTAEFLPGAPAALNSVVAVLNRYPRNDIMISGNTNGYYSSKFERKLSEDRAEQVSAYLWAHGIGNDNISNPNENFGGRNLPKRYTRNLSYVGYGNHFPTSNNITAEGVRQNSRIQISASPPNKTITMNNRSKTVHQYKDAPSSSSSSTLLSEDPSSKGDEYRPISQVTPPPTSSTNADDYKGESWEEYVERHPSEPVVTPPVANIGCYKN